MVEQTLETQLQESVAKYIESGNKIDKFTNGRDNETVETAQGPKPTISKIIKDNLDTIAASRTELDNKVTQASTSATAAEQAKTDAQAMLTAFENTHLPNLNSSISANTSLISTLNTTVSDLTISFNNGFDSLSDVSGYTKLPNGLIVQWGRVGGTTTTVTFPVAFTESVYSITGSIYGISARTGNDSDSGFMAYSISSTGFTGRIGRAFQTSPWSWIAIGK